METGIGRAEEGASPRARETRRRILEAALAEFAEHGLAGARVDAIADRAGTNKRMLYVHFGGKDALWLAVLEEAYARKRGEEARALDLDSLPPAEAVAALVRFNLRYTAAHPEFVALLNQENVHRAEHLRRSAAVRALYAPALAALARTLERGAAEGVFRTGVDPLQAYVTAVAVGHFYVANLHTLSAIFGASLGDEAAVAAREAHCVEAVLGWLRP
jgi:AcrR family transcriptional regulator